MGGAEMVTQIAVGQEQFLVLQGLMEQIAFHGGPLLRILLP